MSDQSQTTTDTAGITRDQTGTLQEPGSNQNSNQESTEESQSSEKVEAKPDGKTTLLNDKEAKPEGAPEKYEDFKVPEGFEFEPEGLKAAQDLFKSLNLPQAAAQQIVDLHAKELKAALEASVNEVDNMREGWRKEILADPEIGGKLKEVKATVGRAIDQHLGATLGPAFREAMDLTGAGDHPAFIRGFYKFAQLVTEGRHVSGGGPSEHGQRAPGRPAGTGAAAMYPNLPSAGR